jgi:hypothetical protein
MSQGHFDFYFFCSLLSWIVNKRGPSMTQYIPASLGDAYEAENTFYLRSHPTRIAKFLAHYEIYKMIVELPGAVAELGVYKGASLIRFATFRGILENSFSRPIIGFDAFGAFPRGEVKGKSDQAFIDRFEGAGGAGISKTHLEGILKDKAFENVQLVEGNVFSTLPAYIESNPAQRFALIHLDMDVYEPTAFALDLLMSRMVKGGIVLFDDYTLVEGATRAADEVIERLGLRMRKLDNYVIPAFFYCGI